MTGLPAGLTLFALTLLAGLLTLLARLAALLALLALLTLARLALLIHVASHEVSSLMLDFSAPRITTNSAGVSFTLAP